MASESHAITLEQLRHELAQATERFSMEMRRILQEERELATSSGELSSELDLKSCRNHAVPGNAAEQGRGFFREYSGFTRQFSPKPKREPSKRNISRQTSPSTDSSSMKDAFLSDAVAAERGASPCAAVDPPSKVITSGAEYCSLMPTLSGAAAVAGDEREDVVKSWIHGRNVQKFMAAVVCLNGLVMSYQVSAEVQNKSIPAAVALCDRLCLCVFIIEIVLRLAIDGSAFFCSEKLGLNMLDLSLVITQCVGLSMRALDWIDVRSLRLLRLLRLTRFVRLFVLLNPLLAVCTALMHSVGALFWTLTLLFMAIYIASMIILHVIVHVDAIDEAVVQHWFGGIVVTMLSLFECIAGGVSWDELVRPLFMQVSPCVGIVLLVYIVSGFLFMLNLITGIFVDQVVKSACEDRDGNMVDYITELFLGDGDGEMSLQERERQIEKEEFVAKMQHPTMQDYFKRIDLSPAQAHKLFDLLDVDGSGSVSAEEVVQGCLTLRGSARGLDAQLLMREMAEVRALLTKLAPRRGQFSV